MMTDFKKKWAERREKWEQQEQRRIGDIYNECIKRGCDIRFLKQFDTRIWLFPVEQTSAFLDLLETERQSSDVVQRLEMWKTYLQVMLEKRKQHEKAEDWMKSLKLMEKHDIK